MLGKLYHTNIIVNGHNVKVSGLPYSVISVVFFFFR